MRRFLAILWARNLEFVRDRSSFGWNIAFPVLLVMGLAIVFSGPERPQYKVAVVGLSPPFDASIHPFMGTRYVEFFPVTDQARALRGVAQHRIDMLLDFREAPQYWVNPESPKGYFLERVLDGAGGLELHKRNVAGAAIRYIDWLVPGILGMNMMFSCLYGIGYVVVRYRKNGFLKRLYVTPLRAVEFLSAQVASRLLLILAVTVAVYVGADWLLSFRMEGSYTALLLVTLLGALSMITLGLLVAARLSSEELANGLLNVVAWPMMLFSEVWFSLEGTHPLLQQLAQLLPLTQLLEAARAVMLDGAGFQDVRVELFALGGMSLLFLALGGLLFKWNPE